MPCWRRSVLRPREGCRPVERRARGSPTPLEDSGRVGVSAQDRRRSPVFRTTAPCVVPATWPLNPAASGDRPMSAWPAKGRWRGRSGQPKGRAGMRGGLARARARPRRCLRTPRHSCRPVCPALGTRGTGDWLAMMTNTPQAHRVAAAAYNKAAAALCSRDARNAVGRSGVSSVSISVLGQFPRKLQLPLGFNLLGITNPTFIPSLASDAQLSDQLFGQQEPV